MIKAGTLIAVCLVSLACGQHNKSQEAATAQPGQALSVAAVAGNPDKAKDAATQFLTGCDFEQGVPVDKIKCKKAGAHAPAAWTKRYHLHVNDKVDDYSTFFLDEDLAKPTGMDMEASEGLEIANILFYAGEGDPTSFSAQRNRTVSLSSLSLGDGEVRYLFMLTCNVFAHGPLRNNDFSQPHKFNPQEWAKEPTTHENVFARWAPKAKKGPLNPRLRLACGGSSKIGNSDYPTHGQWHYYLHGFGPARSFLLGYYHPERDAIPLCISRGDGNLGSSGIDDASFVTEIPKKDLSAIHIAYPKVGKEDGPLAVAARAKQSIRFSPQRSFRQDDPKDLQLPVLVVTRTPVPGFLQNVNFGRGHNLGYGFRGGSARTLGAPLNLLYPVDGAPAIEPTSIADNLCLKQHRETGAVTLAFKPALAAPLSEIADWATLESTAALIINHFINEDQSTEGFAFSEAQPIEIEVSSAPLNQAESSEMEVRSQTKCRFIRLNTAYKSNAGNVDLLGEGAETLIGACPRSDAGDIVDEDSSTDACTRSVLPTISASFNRRQIKGEINNNEMVSRETAVEQVKARLSEVKPGVSYNEIPANTRWGYRVAPVHCTQNKMYIVYEFDFAPQPGVGSEKHPLITIEVPAHVLPEGKTRIEETWDCSPE